ncbi:hypothetical protein MC7420_2095 [Coleofasciculus chthonoplastes PCC 7420]|uniref:Uncharacterized protein n=1 Tax=Coleofasciculus chthonoplastes PCC 7420 TaxID=118168 RepID=B4VS64_9CYAN|nr:hypothetical protein MC7420_2095 [Coleofasciculus chthonoplastes PCC 7420]
MAHLRAGEVMLLINICSQPALLAEANDILRRAVQNQL